MANGEDTPWWKDAKGIVLVITAIFSGIGAVQSQCNGKKADIGNDKIDHVATVQSEQLQTAAVIKEDLKEAADKTDRKLESVVNKVQVIDAKLPKKN